MRTLLTAAMLSMPLLSLASPPALAHAVLMQSQPAEHATIPAGTGALMLRYNSRIDHARSRLTLQGTNAQMVLPIESSSAPDALAAKVELSPGDYVVHWQVLATDGHLTRGDLHFTVVPK